MPQSSDSALGWMVWTTPTAIFFIVIALLIVAFTVWGIVSPPVERRGFLPMPTTRGDRLFVGLLGSAFIHLIWIALTVASPWIATGISLLYMLAIGRWG
jgi:predicted small integral membrane protein